MTRRTIMYMAGASVALLSIAAIGGLWAVRSQWFREKVRERIVQEVEKASGGRVELGSFDFDWGKLEARVARFTLHGKEPAGEDPLFQAGEVKVGLKVISAFRRDVDIASLEIDRPRLSILVDSEGKTNLPTPKLTRSGGPNVLEQVIRLAVGHIDIRNGVVRYDTETIPIDVRGERVNVSLDYDGAAKRYVGRVGAEPVTVRTTGIEPIRVERVDTRVIVENDAVRFTEARLRMKQSSVEASGELHDLKNLAAEFQVKVEAAMSEIGPIVHSPLLHEGTGRFEGTIRLGGGRPVEIAGALEGQGLGYRYQGWTLRGARASGRLQFTPAVVELTGLRIAVLGGTFNGGARLEGLHRFRVKGAVNGFSLARLSQGQVAKPLEWSGLVSGNVDLDGSIQPGRIQDTSITAVLKIAETEGGVALSGALDMAYRQRAGTLTFGPSWLATAATRVNFEGSLGDRLRVGLVSSNLNDALPAFALTSATPPAQMPVELQQGEAQFDGWVTGPLDHPVIAGATSITKFLYEGRLVDSAKGSIEVSQDGVRLTSASLSMGSLRLQGSGRIGLTQWKPGDDPAVAADFTLLGADIQSLIGKQQPDLPVRGVVEASGKLEGTVRNLRGTARVQAANAYLGEQHFERIGFELQFNNNRITVTNGKLAAGASLITVLGTWVRPPDGWKGGTVQATVATNGFPLSQIAGLELNDVNGAIDLQTSFGVAWEREKLRVTTLQGHAALRDLTYQKTPLGGLSLDAATQGSRVKLTATGALRNSKVAGEGTFDLTGDYPGGGRLTVTRLDFADLEPFAAARYPTGFPFRGFLQGGVTFDGNLVTPDGVRAQVRVETVEIRPKERQRLGAPIETPPDLALRNAAPVVLTIDRRGIAVTSCEFVARNTDFFASGMLALGSKSPWDLKLKGKVDLIILNSFNRDMQAAGVSTLDATVRGSLAEPQVSGRMELSNASFYLKGLPNGIEKANGVLLFDRNRANVESLTAQTGGGEISLGGFVGFGGDDVIYRLQAKASRVRVRYPEGVSTTADADLSLTGTSSRSLLAGTITVIRSGFTARTDLGGLLAQAGKPLPAPSAPSEFLQGMQFDVKVDTSPNVEFQTSLTRDLRMEATLRLRGSPSKPVLLGTVTVNRGEIQFFGNKYTINRGEISFFNSAKIEPSVNMDLETRVRAVTVNINFAGPVDKLNVTYRSDPPLQSSEIIALLTVGRSPAASDPNVASDQQQTQGNQSLFQSGANSLLGQAVAAPVSSRLERFFGVSRLKIDPQLTGIDNTPQARLTLEQQISKDVTLTYVTNLNRSQQQLVRLEWNLSQEWSVIAVRDENGVFGMDFQYRRRIH
jgi:translocation and assembly module TamB